MKINIFKFKFKFLKVLMIYMIYMIWAISGCVSSEVKPFEPNANDAFKAPEIIDLSLKEDLKKVWSKFFVNDFSDTQALDIYFATNRTLKSAKPSCDDKGFTNTGDQQLKFGVCRINAPRNHITGEIQYSKDPRQSSNDYFKNINYKPSSQLEMLEIFKKSKRIPLVFVHGFNVNFQEAILRATQIAYDLKYQGPVFVFSWPAGAGDGFLDEKLINVTYKNNKKSAEDTVQLLVSFLKQLEASQLKINLLVHSMGHQVVLNALNELTKENLKDNLNESSHPSPHKLINELILNAPDFDQQLFIDVADNIKKLAERVTLYCSYNDNAILASEFFNKTTRLGACANIPGVDSINVSLIDAPTLGVGGLGHGYYASRPILSDLFQVLLGIEAEKRLFIRKSEPNSTEQYYIRP